MTEEILTTKFNDKQFLPIKSNDIKFDIKSVFTLRFNDFIDSTL